MKGNRTVEEPWLEYLSRGSPGQPGHAANNAVQEVLRQCYVLVRQYYVLLHVPIYLLVCMVVVSLLLID